MSSEAALRSKKLPSDSLTDCLTELRDLTTAVPYLSRAVTDGKHIIIEIAFEIKQKHHSNCLQAG